MLELHIGCPNEIARALESAIATNRITCDEVVLIEVGPFYAQLLCNGDGVFGEVVSNTYLVGPNRLSPKQERRLQHLGWQAPDTPCHSQCARPHPNWHRIWLPHAPTGRIVRDVLTATIANFMDGEGQLLTMRRHTRSSQASRSSPPNH